MLLAIRLHFLSTMPTKKDNSYCVKRKTACNSHAHSEIVTDGFAFTLRKTVGMTQKPTISGAVVRDGRLELPTSCSQSKRATNCANPGFLVIQFCSRCGQTCGQAVFLTILACGGSACIAGVSRDCGHDIFWLERGASCSQTRRDTNFAIPGDVPLSYHVLQEKATGRAQKICARPDLFAVPQFGFELPKVPKLCIFKRL